jgi:hypothetical protein
MDTEDKLGQPMTNFSVSRDWGTVDIFWMPFFRERTFVGTGGRMRGATIVDEDRSQYESAAEEWHSDWALRYSHTFDDIDVGLSHSSSSSNKSSFAKKGHPENIYRSPIARNRKISHWLTEFVFGIHIFD